MTLLASAPAAGRSARTAALLGCGAVYGLAYVVANDAIAAGQYPGYNRIDQAVSELSAKGSPARAFLVAMLPVGAGLMAAFGVGVWRAAGGSRALRVTGALLLAHAAVGIAWLPFPMTSRQDMFSGNMPANDAGHLVLAALTIGLITAQVGSAAVAFGPRFRMYSLVTVATVLACGALSGTQAPKLPRGEPTPWMGLSERVSIGAWLLWLAVLAGVLIRRASTGTAAPAASRTPEKALTGRAASA